MTIKVLVAKSLILALSLTLIPTLAIAAPKVTPGATCKVNKQTVTYLKKVYTCVKSGKKLVWNKGVLVTKSKRISAPSESGNKDKVSSDNNSYVEPIMKSLPIEKCKIKDISNERILYDVLASGFPFVPFYSTLPKEIKMALVPIDFSDLPGRDDFKARAQSQMETTSDWYSQVSGGRLTVSWTIGSDWIRLPGSSKDYSVPYSGAYPETSNFWKKVIPIVDSKFDLTGIQTLNFILPSGQKIIEESVQSFPNLDEMKFSNSSKTKLISFATAGVYFDSPGRNYWSYWAHEFGHVLGLAHVGSSRGSSQTMNAHDLMGNQDGPYRELSGWMRFIIGWLDDSQVYCQDVENLTTNEISLVPLSDLKSGIKLVVIPTSVDSAIIIDSRRPTKFSCDIPNLPSGVLVYTYDAKLGNQSYFLTAQYPNNRPKVFKCPQNERMEFYPDALLHKGDSIQVGNYQISVVSSGNFDQIRIKKK
jgi:M6 family metalloprotease-like protein